MVLAIVTVNVVVLLACYPSFSWEAPLSRPHRQAPILIALTKLPVPTPWEQLMSPGRGWVFPSRFLNLRASYRPVPLQRQKKLPAAIFPTLGRGEAVMRSRKPTGPEKQRWEKGALASFAPLVPTVPGPTVSCSSCGLASQPSPGSGKQINCPYA